MDFNSEKLIIFLICMIHGWQQIYRCNDSAQYDVTKLYVALLHSR